MKNLILILSLVLANGAAASSFGEWKAMDQGPRLLSLVMNACPAKMADAFKGADFIKSVTYVGGMQPNNSVLTTYTITTAKLPPKYFMEAKLVKVLKIKELVQSFPQAASRPNEHTYNCKLIEVSNNDQ